MDGDVVPAPQRVERAAERSAPAPDTDLDRLPPPSAADREPTGPLPAAVEDPSGTTPTDGVADLTEELARFVPSPRPRPDDIPCPRCPAVNLPERELCWRCGIDLETGRSLAQPLPSYGDGPVETSLSPPVRHAWWLAPVAIVGVAGAILAGLWLAGIGPFASEPDLPAAEFVADHYPAEEPELLLLSDIATMTSRPPQGERTYPVEQMVDADPATAWHSQPDDLPDGVDEKVDLFLEEPAWVAQIVINNGDHADATTYEASGRIQRAALVMDGDERMEIVLLDLGREPQAITLPEPVLTTTVRLELLDVLPGSEHAGAAISDLELRGWSADDDDADLAARRADVRQAAGSFTLPD